ncbi:MAG: DegT/DnrJ/EryC1/StrS family aminotransferase [Spirochaeta sp.]|nr:DegT/DnrJ/EryC1/StrS family aminotransferase [Spirochaeta sp.]
MILFSRPSIKRRDMDAVLSCMVEDTLGPGERTRAFCAALGEYLGMQEGGAFREYRRAVRAAFLSLELPLGARPALSVLAPRAYYEVASELGLEPLLFDVDSSSGVIDSAALERSSPESCGVVVLDHPLGFVPDHEAVYSLGVPVIEDISHALGAHDGTRLVGSGARFTVMALETDCIITTGGGAVVLPSGKKERSALRTHISALAADTMLPDMNAALGLTQMRELPRFIERRMEISAYFQKAIAPGAHKSLHQSGDAENLCYAFPVVLETGVGVVLEYAKKKKVVTQHAFSDSILAHLIRLHTDRLHSDGSAGNAVQAPSTLQQSAPHAHSVPHPDSFPVARDLVRRCILFPIYPTLSRQEVETVSRVLSTLP